MNPLEEFKKTFREMAGIVMPDVMIGPKTVIYTKMCDVTKEYYSVAIDVDKYNEWQAGAYIQDVLWCLSPEQRQFLISGTTPDEWDVLFEDEEE